ncbi:MAG: LPS export ABC transporter ATP-binding protein [Acidobacteria bacterium]|nr:LPS export ABC transporter ATP-binding protein [Acidobacteriota bacterium]
MSETNGALPCPPDANGGASLAAHDLQKAFRHHRAVDGVSVSVAPGEIVGLLGPNGAGKTTTFAMIVGLLRPDRGSIRLAEDDITDLPLNRRALRGIAYLPQEPSVFRRLTVRGNLELVLEALGHDDDVIRDSVTTLLADFGLDAVADRPAYLLSGGERRRCEIARAMAICPKVFLLDEPFAGIDPIAVADIQRIVKRLAQRGIGVLITDHNVRETLQITDRAYIINRGKIFRSGSPHELAIDAEVRAVYLGEDFRLA